MTLEPYHARTPRPRRLAAARLQPRLAPGSESSVDRSSRAASALLPTEYAAPPERSLGRHAPLAWWDRSAREILEAPASPPGSRWAELHPRAVLWLKWVSLGVTLLTVFAVLTLFLVIRHFEADLPSVSELKGNYHPPQVTRVLARDGTVLAELFTERRTVVPIASLPRAREARRPRRGGRGLLRARGPQLLRHRCAPSSSTCAPGARGRAARPSRSRS